MSQQQQDQQAPTSAQAPASSAPASPPASSASGGGTANGSGRSSGCPPHVLAAIYGTNKQEKKAAYEASLQRWWTEYADRKNDEEDEYVANSLLYDRRHLPRTAPAPECVQRAMAQGGAAPSGAAQPQPTALPAAPTS